MHLQGPWFKDEDGRTLILRGVNLGGSSKVPFEPNGATHIREGFFQHREISFVGRPFPLEEMDAHFERLRAWGFTFLRFLITWEAIEHAGPGIYDEAYLDYVVEVVKRAGDYGINLFIDPHQDVWSRFSGGDGAPGWTFELVGMDMTRFSETGAAIVHATHGDPFPDMIWFTNYSRLASATMFTLFFGGNDFAPGITVGDVPIQEFLQSHYINAVKQLVQRVKDIPNVVGYDTLNEPSAGYLGIPDLNDKMGLVYYGPAPTAFQTFLLGAGYPQEVGVWDFGRLRLKRIDTRILNPDGASLWMEGYAPLWQQQGVWDVSPEGEPRLLRPDYFARVGGRDVEFYEDYFRPFANRYAREVRDIDPDAIIFVEGIPSIGHPRWGTEDALNIVNASHWYDGVTLLTKNFVPWLTIDVEARRPVLGKQAVLNSFKHQLGTIKERSRIEMGNVPTLIGEFGIPFDMKQGMAYRTGDFTLQKTALDANYQAIEANLLDSTLWNYTADNDNARGDQWNGEDFSIFSPDQQQGTGEVHDGARALEAVVRPYARAVAGTPLQMHFDMGQRIFEFAFKHDPAVVTPTEVFVPNFQYPHGYGVEVSDGTYVVDQDTQTLTYRHTQAQDLHWIHIWAADLGRPVEEEARKHRVTLMAILSVLIATALVIWRLVTRQKRQDSEDI